MVLLIDNYDSFTYNIFQEISELGAEVRVIRNDRITIDGVLEMAPERVIISPGPGRPENAGISVSLIKELAGKIPVLGVCLGHQALGYAYGGKIVGAKRLMHGKTSMIFHDGSGIFAGIPNPFEATRYHSLLVEKETIPDSFKITAWTEDNEIMGLQVKGLPLFGVQFHPESILTKEGINILRNFLKI
ncbi:MAG: aminodeoxychorismate/anthranilate synthase component II [Candidatus Omnitrophota bacterium]|nr:aminodeoxychorismate/anthranilate synthase component II [Candidatus Omnitrophota bacterium]